MGHYEGDHRSPLVSDTKELIWKYGKPKEGLVTVNTLKTEGFIGFCGGKDYSLNNLCFNVENPRRQGFRTGNPDEKERGRVAVCHWGTGNRMVTERCDKKNRNYDA